MPRISDLDALTASTAGKVEIEAFEEGRAEAVLSRLVSAAVLSVFKQRCAVEGLRDVLAGFDGGTAISTGDDVPSADYVEALGRFPALRSAVLPLVDGEAPGVVASAVELVLEGLHLSRRLNKDSVGARATYRSR